MSTNILSISLAALSAAQAGIRTTQQNISNVNTPGFRRQQVNYSNSTPFYSGMVTAGSGVKVDGVSRIYDRFLENQVLLSQAQLSRYDAYATYTSQVDSLLGNSYTGLSTGLNDFFGAANEVANDPTSVAARQMLLTSGENLAGRINNLNDVMAGMQSGMNNQMSAIADQVSNYAKHVAQLSDQIALQEGTTGQTANDLRDMRDQVAAEINKLVNVTSFTQQDGTYGLYIGSGQPLVVGNTASTMVMKTDPVDPRQQVPALVVNGVQIPLNTTLITGGQLGGMLSFREEVLNPAQQDLARMAASFAMAFNTQHRAGFDQDGAAGSNFFANPAVPQTGTTPAINLDLVDDRQLIPGNYQLSFDGSNYTLVNGQDASVIGTYASLGSLNTALATRGFQLSAAPSGAGAWNINFDDYPRQMTVAIDDVRKVAAASTTGSPGDNTNALALAGLQTDPVMNGGTASFKTFYSQVSSRVANQAHAADASQKAYDVLTKQAYEASQSVSGVNLDEEAANLIRYQQAYQAAAKAMQISSSLFDEILAIAR